MSEKHQKLKLKRKKVAIQGDKCEQHSSVVIQKSTGVPIPFSSSESDLRTEATGVKPGEWWDSPDLQATEKLWAVTLKSAIPNLGHSVWETTPELPLASLVTRPLEEESGWKWCSLNEEVGPLPSPPKPSASSSAFLDCHGPNPTNTGPVSEGAETPPTPSQQNGRPGSVSSQELGEGMCARNPGPVICQSSNRTGQRPQNPPSSREVLEEGVGREVLAREENASAGRPSLAGAGSGGEVGGAGGGVIKRRLPASRGAGSGSRAPEEQLGRGGSSGEGHAPGNAATQRNTEGGPAATMETCPMCLLPFTGFTQMECDSHLAKCLSLMSEDITW